MRIYLRRDGSRTINSVNYKEIKKLGGVRDLSVFDYYNKGKGHLITIERNGVILCSSKYKNWEAFEKAHGEYDFFNSSAQAFSFLRENGYL